MSPRIRLIYDKIVATPGKTEFFKSLLGGDSSALFDVAVASSGNVYSVGYITGTGTYGFGSVIVAGSSALMNSVLVEFNSSGVAQWAQTVTSGTDESRFASIAVDNSENVYVVGSITGNGAFGFGNGVTATGSYSGGTNAALVQYNSSGIAQWAKTITAGTGGSGFSSVTIDSSENVYAVGSITGSGAYGFGNGVTTNGAYSGGTNAALVQYNPSGDAQWAQTVTSGSGGSGFSSVTVDSSDNVYVVGSITGNGEFGFGNGITATGAYSGGANVVLVKY